jgi:hypothetical protein
MMRSFYDIEAPVWHALAEDRNMQHIFILVDRLGDIVIAREIAKSEPSRGVTTFVCLERQVAGITVWPNRCYKSPEDRTNQSVPLPVPPLTFVLCP